MNFKNDKTKKSGKYNDIGNIAFQLIQTALNSRDDLTVFIMTHSETVTNAQTGLPMDVMKSIGKLVTEKFNMEGCFNYVLFANSEVVEGENGPRINKYFITQSDGSNTAKTPIGVFDSVKIPNDLGYILDKITEYENGD